MQEKYEKKIRAFMPYMIVIGVVYLLVPALLLVNASVLTYLVLIGILPLTALLCCAHYSMRSGSDFSLSLFAPLCFVITMLLYRLVQTDPLRAFIYLIAYFLCGYLGLTIGDILSNRPSAAKPSARSQRSAAPAPRSRESMPAPLEARPRRVNVDAAGESASMSRPAPSNRPRRVNVDAAEPAAPVRRPSAVPRARQVDVEAAGTPASFRTADPSEDRSLDLSTTSDDIDAILREIHQRRGSE